LSASNPLIPPLSPEVGATEIAKSCRVVARETARRGKAMAREMATEARSREEKNHAHDAYGC
jgi:hypothetical protein